MTLPTPKTLPAQSSDAELVTLSLRGDQRAFRQLMQRYLPAVYNYLYRMTQNHEISEEMAQEAFVKAFHHLNRFDPSRAFKPWILRIASNAALSELRKQSKVVSLNALEEDGQWNESEHQSQEDLVTGLERKLSNEELMKAIGKLDDKYKQALLLRYQQDLSYEDVAQSLEIPLNTARTWIKRGLEKLKNEVKEIGS
jgi:RNA polymerase sigma-70 factor (ECF subfamily)